MIEISSTSNESGVRLFTSFHQGNMRFLIFLTKYDPLTHLDLRVGHARGDAGRQIGQELLDRWLGVGHGEPWGGGRMKRVQQRET